MKINIFPAICLFLLSLMFFGLNLNAQTDTSFLVHYGKESLNISSLLEELSKQTNSKFSYNPKKIPLETEVGKWEREMSLGQVLNSLHMYGIEYRLMEDHIVLRYKPGLLIKDSKVKVYTISGFVTDRSTGEALIAATVALEGKNLGTISNGYGFYSLSLDKGEYELFVSYVGLKTIKQKIILQADTVIDFKLEAAVADFEEVVIISDELSRINDNSVSGSTVLNVTSIKKSPGFLGEADVIKSLQSVPGINFYNDGSTIFHVRGGDRDQNLILIDEAPVYNPAHMLGIFSVFTPGSLNSVNIYKGDMPSSFGGRLSSVIDIKTKEGNNKKLSFSGAISPVATSLSLEGPVFQKKSSFYLSGRRSHLKWLLGNDGETLSELYFSDFNFKYNYRLNESNRLFLSLYAGKDKMRNRESFLKSSGISWKNFAGTLRWNHLFGDKLFMNNSFIASNYNYDLFTSYELNNRWNSQISLFAFKSDFSYYISPKSTLKFGIFLGDHQYFPGNFLSGDNLDPLVPGVPDKRSNESSIYLNHEFWLSEKLVLRYGFRLTSWKNKGETYEFEYNNEYQPVDTFYYAGNVVYNKFFSFEPRMSLNWFMNNSLSFKMAFARNSQFEYLITNSVSPFTSLEVWLPAGPNIKPMFSDQITSGFTWKSKDLPLYFSFEGFYKIMYNYISYADHAYMLFNPHVESELRFGKGKAFGAEFLIKKTEGRLNGWMSYTRSRSLLKISGINSLNYFPARYDRPNSFDLNISYRLKTRWSIGANFIYSSGNPVTTPTGYYFYNNYQVPFYEERNNDRLPNYHRLDLSTEIQLNKLNSKNEHKLLISIFNIYNRQNPFNINFNKIVDESGNLLVPLDHSEPPELQPSVMYLYGFIPSISYQFSF